MSHCKGARSYSCSSLDQLPPELLSNILAWYSNGKSISTFAIVVQGSRSFQRRAAAADLSIIQHALTLRFKSLAAAAAVTVQHKMNKDEIDPVQTHTQTTREDLEMIQDVWMVLGEDIRTCDDELQDMKKLSEYCAILDYLEAQVPQGTYVIWTGPLETQYGVLQVKLETPHWTPTALQYWYNDFELYQFSLATPAVSLRLPFLPSRSRSNNNDDDDDDDDTSNLPPQPYGSLSTLASTRPVWKRVLYHLNEEWDAVGRFALVPRHLDFDANPSILFTKPQRRTAMFNSYDDNSNNNNNNMVSMKCYWDQDDGYDWDEGMERLGEHVIRILQRLGPAFPNDGQFQEEENDEDEDSDDDDSEDDSVDGNDSDSE
jgi:hypothetical protein